MFLTAAAAAAAAAARTAAAAAAATTSQRRAVLRLVDPAPEDDADPALFNHLRRLHAQPSCCVS